MTLVDIVRITLAAVALLLAVACGIAAAVSPTWDQRARFGVVLGYASIILGGQLDQIGTPATWRTWALVFVSAAAIISTGAFLIRHVRSTRGGPRDGRSADHQRSVLRPRAATRRARDTGNGEGSEGGSAAP